MSTDLHREKYDRTSTCDGCAVYTNVRLSDPDDGNSSYVCNECDRQFDAAVDAAAVVLALELRHSLVSISPMVAAPNTRRIAEAVIKAFIKADWAEVQRRKP